MHVPVLVTVIVACIVYTEIHNTIYQPLILTMCRYSVIKMTCCRLKQFIFFSNLLYYLESHAFKRGFDIEDSPYSQHKLNCL